jgi:hypothetical protein
METQAATPTGAEASARADVSAPSSPPPSIHERLKAHLTPPEPQEAPERAPAKAPNEPVVQATEEVDEPAAVSEPAAAEAEPQADDALTEAQLSSIVDLADATGLELDKLMDLDIPTKIDGKEGKARLRDMIKSYQLEGHLNQKLMTFADEKKAFETERQTHMQQSQQKFMQLDAGIQVAHRLLQEEFADVNWQQLQNESPLEFNQRYVAFQQRQAQLNNLASMIGQERQGAEARAAAQEQAYLSEQAKLLDSKLPEWADQGKRNKDIAEMSAVLNSAYGITEPELRALKDHRQVLALRDAWKWQQLQKAKPSVLNKVKVAPKLLKPGAQQSRAAQDGFIAQKERERLRSSGKVLDAKASLKRLLFS